MPNKKEIIKFQVGKIYTAYDIQYFCEAVTEDEVTFRKMRKVRSTGKLRKTKNPVTLKIVGKREAQQKAVIYTYYVDRQQYKKHIFAA